MTNNQIDNYNALQKQDTKNRKLIKKLQLDKQALKEQLSLYDVSHRREQLIAYEKFANKEMYNDLEQQINKIIDNFLAINCG